jgi:hypothetical protein
MPEHPGHGTARDDPLASGTDATRPAIAGRGRIRLCGYGDRVVTRAKVSGHR